MKEIFNYQMTRADWVPLMKEKAAAIITDQGAAHVITAIIVSRELGIPAIIGVLIKLLMVSKRVPLLRLIVVKCRRLCL